jgi:hypothetical protein
MDRGLAFPPRIFLEVEPGERGVPANGCGGPPRIFNPDLISGFNHDVGGFFINISMLPENARKRINRAVVWKGCRDENIEECGLILHQNGLNHVSTFGRQGIEGFDKI